MTVYLNYLRSQSLRLVTSLAPLSLKIKEMKGIVKTKVQKTKVKMEAMMIVMVAIPNLILLVNVSLYNVVE